MHIAYQRNRCSEILADLSRIHVNMNDGCISSLKLVRFDNRTVCHSCTDKHKHITLMDSIVGMWLAVCTQHTHI